MNGQLRKQSCQDGTSTHAYVHRNKSLYCVKFFEEHLGVDNFLRLLHIVMIIIAVITAIIITIMQHNTEI